MSAQKTIPFKEFTKEQLGNREIVRANSKSYNEEVVKIPIDQIVLRQTNSNKRFNPRQVANYGDLTEMAQSLRKMGQLQPGRVVSLRDGRFALIAGHRRLAAWRIVQDEDRIDCYFTAIVNSQKTTEIDLLLQSFLTQQEKPLEQHEIAELFSRLIEEGMTQTEITEYTGKTDSYVSQLLKFSREPEEIKEVVRMGNMSVHTAIQAISKIKDPVKRVAAVKTAAEKQFEKSEKAREKYADSLEYDENLVARPKKEKTSPEEKENIVKKTDNVKKGKRLKIDEIGASNTVIIPTLKSVEGEIKKLPAPDGNPDFNKGFAACLKLILPLFKTRNETAEQKDK